MLLPQAHENIFEHITFAYKTLKCEVYVQQHNLRLRQRIAEFESRPGFKKRLIQVAEVMCSKKPEMHQMFLKWLEEINYVLLPKAIVPLSSAAPMRQGFFSNRATGEKYQTNKVNYFFDGPIELHLIGMLWAMNEGRYLDRNLSDACLGTRLHPSIYSERHKIPRLFRSYAPEYAKWRDEAVDCAQRILIEKKQDVCILSLDFESFYYRLKPDFEAISKYIAKEKAKNPYLVEIIGYESLLPAVEAICLKYRTIIQPHLRVTHNKITGDCGIPIEICFSPIIANWSLRKFDRMITQRMNPHYYARYVDDLLLVLPTFGSTEPNPIEGVMQKQFVDRGILEKEDESYLLVGKPELRLQQTKCILHHFNANDSLASLDNFRRKIGKLSSEFRELPAEGFDRPFKEVAWELLYDGSQFKWRSFTGIGEDKNELAQFLRKRCVLLVYTDPTEERHYLKDLEAFFKGRNALQYYELWERLITLLILADARDAFDDIKQSLNDAIAKLEFTGKTDAPPITVALKQSLKLHFKLCESMAAAVLESPNNFIAFSDKTLEISQALRNSKMMRHYFLKPSESSSGHSLLGTQGIFFGNKEAATSSNYEFSPRFIHIDELMINAIENQIGEIRADFAFKEAKQNYYKINKLETQDIVVDEWESEQ